MINDLSKFTRCYLMEALSILPEDSLAAENVRAALANSGDLLDASGSSPGRARV